MLFFAVDYKPVPFLLCSSYTYIYLSITVTGHGNVPTIHLVKYSGDPRFSNHMHFTEGH